MYGRVDSKAKRSYLVWGLIAKIYKKIHWVFQEASRNMCCKQDILDIVDSNVLDITAFQLSNIVQLESGEVYK